MHVIALEQGHEVAQRFYDYIQTVVNNYLLVEGHSIGIGDTIADNFTYGEIQRAIHKAKVGLQYDNGVMYTLHTYTITLC